MLAPPDRSETQRAALADGPEAKVVKRKHGQFYTIPLDLQAFLVALTPLFLVMFLMLWGSTR